MSITDEDEDSDIDVLETPVRVSIIK